MSEARFTEPEALLVRFSGILAALGVLPFALVMGGMLLIAPDRGLFFGILAAVFLVPTLLMIAASFDRRPLLAIEPGGVRLVCAGDILLGYDEIQVWAEKSTNLRNAYWIFSLQCRPRRHLEISWWTWLRFVRVNTLIGGDLYLDQRFISIHPKELTALTQARIDQVAAEG